MNRYRELLKNSLIFAIGNLSIKIIQFFLLPLVTISLTTSEYGSAESLISLVELVLPVFTLGITDAVFRFSMEPNVDQKEVFSLSLVVFTLGTVIVVAGSGIMLRSYNQDYRIVFILLYIVTALANIWGQFVRGIGKIKIFAFSGIFRSLALALFTYLLVRYLKLGANGYIYASVFAYASAILMFVLGARLWKYIELKRPNYQLLKKMIIYALPLIPNTICWWLIQVANRYILIYYHGESAAGLFISSSKLGSIINMFSTIFLQAWTISAVQTQSEKDKGRFNNNVFEYYSTFIEISATVLLLFLPFISSLLLKNSFSTAWIYSALSIYTAVISCYSAFFGAYYTASLKTKMAFISTLAGAFINVIACIILVPRYGIKGVLYSSVMGYIILTLIRIIDTQKYSQISIKWGEKLPSLALIFVQAVLIMEFTGNLLWMYLTESFIAFTVLVLNFHSIQSVFTKFYNLIKYQSNN